MPTPPDDVLLNKAAIIERCFGPHTCIGEAPMMTAGAAVLPETGGAT